MCQKIDASLRAMVREVRLLRRLLTSTQLLRCRLNVDEGSDYERGHCYRLAHSIGSSGGGAMQRHSSFDPKWVWRLKVAGAEGEAAGEAEDDENEEEEEMDTDEDMEASDEEDDGGRSSDELYSSELQQVCPVCRSILSCRNMKDLAEHVRQQHP